MITSSKNPTIQHIRQLQTRTRTRRETGMFVIEGVRLVEEALLAGIRPQTLIYTPDLDERGEKILAGFRTLGVEPVPVSDTVMQVASDTQTPQGVLAVLPIMPRFLPTHPDFVLILDGVRDPGNLGTILRTADAAGVDAVVLPPETVDPYAPKVLRAGMGAHFHLPIHLLGWEEILAMTSSLCVFLADEGAISKYTETDFSLPLALIIGGEAHGASDEIQRLHPAPVRIPMPGEAESLNAAIAAGILMFEVVRQRNLQAKPQKP
ncbi:MAG TPA: RNA methyltransferase [Anaerolineales bacterium]|nr:RNA methyltransferase [Anaerolineales bacterium]